MGIDVRWEDEDGTLLEEVLDPRTLLIRGIDTPSQFDTVCVRFIDPYGDTVFNQLQVPTLIGELEDAEGRVTDPADRLHLRAVLGLARKCRGEVHTYLRFFGD